LQIERSGCVSSNTGRKSIDDNKGSKKSSPVVWIKDTNKSEEEDKNCTVKQESFITVRIISKLD
jgi:hypothetical protein